MNSSPILGMPEKPVIVNNSPLVLLWKLGHLPLLRELYTTVLIPVQVADEFLATDSDVREDALKNAPWIRTVQLASLPDLEVYGGLDIGETAVLALAEELNARLVIIDEKKARKKASTLGLAVKGTVGVLLEAKQNGLIDVIKPLLRELQANDMYLGDAIINEALQQAGESD